MHITVCYASETGSAEDVAFKIVARAELLQLDVEVVSIDDYNIESLPSEQMIVFVCSTTGDGEIPTSMRTFWKFILR
jgi:sulfite reductase alpha subunit-like flavoprotein